MGRASRERDSRRRLSSLGLRLALPAAILGAACGGGAPGARADAPPVGLGGVVADSAVADSAVPLPVDAPTVSDAAISAQVGSIPSPIRYVLVIVKENHTFDNFFTGFPGADTATTATLSDGTTITRQMAPSGGLPHGLCHSNECGQTAYRDGGMNGFDLNAPDTLPFVYYSEQQIPNYWLYARNFVLVDHMFSTTLGPSTPGHFTFWAAESPVLANSYCAVIGGACGGFGCEAGADRKITADDSDTCTTWQTSPCFDVPSLVDQLPQGFTWADYGGKIALMIKSIADDPNHAMHFHSQGDLVGDLSADKVENLIIAHLWYGAVSEHPPHDPCPGENFTVQIVNAAMQTPEWKHMAIIITWDDWGGFYDHVAPPVHKCANGKVFRSGFRLPAIIISPYAKKGYVLSNRTEQASVPKLIEDLWGMTYMSARNPRARDGVAGSLMGAFDFTQAPRPPLLLTTRTCP